MYTKNSNVAEKKMAHATQNDRVTDETDHQIKCSASLKQLCLVFSHLPSYPGPAIYLKTQCKMKLQDSC